MTQAAKYAPRIGASRRIARGAVAIIVVFCLLTPIFFRPVVQGVDTIGYYSWVRTAVIEQSLDVRSSWEHYQNELILQFPGYRMTTPTGYIHNQWAAGPALLWLPFFLAAHGVVLLLKVAGVPLVADGFSFPYVFAVGIGTCVYVLAALLLLYATAHRYFSQAIAAGSVIVIAFATPLVFYTFVNPFTSHGLDAFAGAFYVACWLRVRDKPTFGRRAALGLVIGLATWIRVQNLLLLVVPALETTLLLFLPRRNAWSRRLGAFLSAAVPLALGVAVLILPLMLFWRVVYGQWIVNTYAAASGLVFDPLKPHLLEVLFSSDRGLFVWSPVLILSMAGTLPLWHRDRRLTMLLVINFLITYFLVASSNMWSGVVAFGARHFVACTSYFVLGLAAFSTRLEPHIKLKWLAVGGVAFIVWNFLLIIQYALEWVPRGGEVDLVKMIVNQFRVVPENFPRIIQAFLNRLSES